MSDFLAELVVVLLVTGYAGAFWAYRRLAERL